MNIMLAWGGDGGLVFGVVTFLGKESKEDGKYALVQFSLWILRNHL